MLDSFSLAELPVYLIKELTIEALISFVDDLRRRMAVMAYPNTE